MLQRLLKSRAEVRILGVVLFKEGLHLREIAREACVSSYEAKKELDNFVSLDLLKKEKKGNMMLFYKNEKCSFLKDLQNLYLKTEGFVQKIGVTLEKMKEINYSFVFGSFGKETFKEKSDIDLMIIGDVDEGLIEREIFKIQKTLEREINFVHWSRKDFRKKLKEKSKFLKNISKNMKWITGDKNEFVRIIKESYD